MRSRLPLLIPIAWLLASCGGSSTIDPTTGLPVTPGGPGGGGSPPAEIVLEALFPPAGPTLGGTALRIRGSGFTDDTLVFVDGALAGPAIGDAVLVAPDELVVSTPEHPEPGAVDVLVGIPDGPAALFQGAYRYERRLVVGTPNEREDGSVAHPIGSVGAAVGLAPEGYEVAVTPGLYPEALVVVGRSGLSVVGTGPEPTVLRSPSGDQAAIGIADATGITLEALVLEGGESGLRLEGASRVTARELVLQDNATGASVGAGATLVLERSTVRRNADAGVFVVDGSLVLSDGVVDGNGTQGVGIVRTGATPPATLRVTGSRLSANGEAGLLAVVSDERDRVAVLGNRIARNGLDAPSPGLAVIAADAPHGERVFRVAGNEIVANSRAGVLVGPGAWVRIGEPDAPNGLEGNGSFGIGCAEGVRATCASGENLFAGNDLGEVELSCPSSCQP